jgi:hypothetical protein
MSPVTPYLGGVTPSDSLHRDAPVDNSPFSVDNRVDLGITFPYTEPPCPITKGAGSETATHFLATSLALPRYPQPMVGNASRLQPLQLRSRGYPPATSGATQSGRIHLPHFPLPYYYD